MARLGHENATLIPCAQTTKDIPKAFMPPFHHSEARHGLDFRPGVEVIARNPD